MNWLVALHVPFKLFLSLYLLLSLSISTLLHLNDSTNASKIRLKSVLFSYIQIYTHIYIYENKHPTRWSLDSGITGNKPKEKATEGKERQDGVMG